MGKFAGRLDSGRTSSYNDLMTKTNNTRPRFTARSFERAHGRRPRASQFGTWTFAPCSSDVAFERDVDRDRVEFFTGTFAEARAAAATHFAGESMVAVLS